MSQQNPIEVVHTRVFAAGPGGGNPCPVIPQADLLTDAQMQSLARKLGLDTAFILSAESNSADLRIRYFVPHHEMGVSGHATVAAITVALLTNAWRSDHVKVETITGIFALRSERCPDGIAVTLEQNEPVFGLAVAPEQVARVLNIDSGEILVNTSPIQSVSVSRAKLLIPLKDSTGLNSLTPDYAALWELSEQLQVSGFYPFTRQPDRVKAKAEARQFPLRAGFPEDPATGVAAAALAAYLATYDLNCRSGTHLFGIAQGYAMGAPSLIEATAQCDGTRVTRTAIRGMAQIVGREQIIL